MGHELWIYYKKAGSKIKFHEKFMCVRSKIFRINLHSHDSFHSNYFPIKLRLNYQNAGEKTFTSQITCNNRQTNNNMKGEMKKKLRFRNLKYFMLFFLLLNFCHSFSSRCTSRQRLLTSISFLNELKIENKIIESLVD